MGDTLGFRVGTLLLSAERTKQLVFLRPLKLCAERGGPVQRMKVRVPGRFPLFREPHW